MFTFTEFFQIIIVDVGFGVRLALFVDVFDFSLLFLCYAVDLRIFRVISFILRELEGFTQNFVV